MEMDLIPNNSICTIKYCCNTVSIEKSFNFEILSQNNINNINNLFPAFSNIINKLLFQY